VKIIIPGRARVKKNGQKVVRTRYGGITKINTPQYIAWHNAAFREALKQKPLGHKPIAVPMNAGFVFYFSNHQHEADLSNLIEGPQDLLKELGFIVDDKLIYSLDGSKKVFSKDEPERVEITLTEIVPDQVSFKA
jgi:Holliday junction resolvase RusA-like endonuclease